MRNPPVIIHREALGSQVAAALREAIAAGKLARGERLIEVDLAAKYGVSRGPIRDAIRILQLEGLVENGSGGVTVAGLDQDDINEIYSLRGAIEGLAVRLIAQRRSHDDYERLGHHVSVMEQAACTSDSASFAQADIAFHNEICLVSRHKRLADVWQRYKAIMMTLLRLTLSPDQDFKASAAKHRKLLDLIRAGDPHAAEAELADHLDGSRARMVRVWEHALERRRSEEAQQ